MFSAWGPLDAGRTVFVSSRILRVFSLFACCLFLCWREKNGGCRASVLRLWGIGRGARVPGSPFCRTAVLIECVWSRRLAEEGCRGQRRRRCRCWSSRSGHEQASASSGARSVRRRTHLRFFQRHICSCDRSLWSRDDSSSDGYAEGVFCPSFRFIRSLARSRMQEE